MKACLDAAGWKYKVTEEDRGYTAKNTVIQTKPASLERWDPKSGETIELTVSTGHY